MTQRPTQRYSTPLPAEAIATGAVTAAKLAEEAVTEPKCAPSLLPIQRLTQRIQHSDLTAAATTQAIAITGFPANSIPLFSVFEIETPFSGGTAAGVVVKAGDAGADTELFGNVSVFTGASGIVQGAPGTLAGTYTLEAAYSPIATFISVGENLVNLTAGDGYVHIYFATPTAVTE